MFIQVVQGGKQLTVNADQIWELKPKEKPNVGTLVKWINGSSSSSDDDYESVVKQVIEVGE